MSNEVDKTMLDSVTSNPQIEDIYNNIIGELEGNGLDDVKLNSALLAATSMGFNDLFNILSRMIVNAYVLEKYMATMTNTDESLTELSNDTIAVINKIGDAVENKDIQSLTSRLNELMQAEAEAAEAAMADSSTEIVDVETEEVENESSVDSEVDKDGSADIS